MCLVYPRIQHTLPDDSANIRVIVLATKRTFNAGNWQGSRIVAWKSADRLVDDKVIPNRMQIWKDSSQLREQPQKGRASTHWLIVHRR